MQSIPESRVSLGDPTDKNTTARQLTARTNEGADEYVLAKSCWSKCTNASRTSKQEKTIHARFRRTTIEPTSIYIRRVRDQATLHHPTKRQPMPCTHKNLPPRALNPNTEAMHKSSNQQPKSISRQVCTPEMPSSQLVHARDMPLPAARPWCDAQPPVPQTAGFEEENSCATSN